MPQKTSFCNGALLRSDARRYWPLLFLYVAVWMFLLPLPLLSNGRSVIHIGAARVQFEQHNLIVNSVYGSVVMALIFGCLFAMAVWSYLMTARTVGLMHALPVTRTQQFCTHSLSAAAMLTAGNLLVFLLSVVCCASTGFVDWGALGQWLLLTELAELFFFALATLCATVTGWLLAIPVLYGALNVLAMLLRLVYVAMAELFYFGYVSNGTAPLVTALTPVSKLWRAVDGGGSWVTLTEDGYEYQQYVRDLAPSTIGTFAVYAAVGIALLGLAWWLYEKRPSESAGDAVSFRWLRPIARWIIGLCGGWGLGMFLLIFVDSEERSRFPALLACQLVMGVICFFAAQMLLQKRFRIFNRRWWIETAALAAVLVAVTTCVKLDIAGYQHRLPDAGQVTSVTFDSSNAAFTAEDGDTVEDALALHRAILAQYDAQGGAGIGSGRLVSAVPTVSADSYDRYATVRLTYRLANGGTLRRAWTVTVEEGSDVCRLLTKLMNHTAYREDMMNLDQLARYGGVDAVVGGYIYRQDTDRSAELSRQQAQELARLALADAADGAGSPITLLTGDGQMNDSFVWGYDIGLRVAVEDDGGSGSVSLQMTSFAKRTQAFIDGLEYDLAGDQAGSSEYVDEVLYD